MLYYIPEIIRFEVEDPSLNEIFISKVGDYFEE